MLQGERTLDDPWFGRVTLSGHGREWAAEGPGLGGRYVLDGLVDGTLSTPHGQGEVRTPWTGIRRRSKDARATVAGREYHLHHRSLRRAELRRDGTVVGTFRGRFRLPFTGGPAMLQPYEIGAWKPGADATDAGVGHVLLARHGAGAEGAVYNALTLFS